MPSFPGEIREPLTFLIVETPFCMLLCSGFLVWGVFWCFFQLKIKTSDEVANRVYKRSDKIGMGWDGMGFQPAQESKTMSEPDHAPLPTAVLSAPCAELQFREEKWDHLKVCGSDFNNQAGHFLNSWFFKAVALSDWGFALCVWILFIFPSFSFVFIVTLENPGLELLF